MYPPAGSRTAFPNGIRIIDDPDIVALECALCGWRAEYSAGGASRDEMLTDANTHCCTDLDAGLRRLAVPLATVSAAL
jgi:hypothetical protein